MIFYILYARKAIMEAAAHVGAQGVAVLANADCPDDISPEHIVRVQNPSDPRLVAQALEPLVHQNPGKRHMCVGLGDESSECALMVNSALNLETAYLPTFSSLETMRDKTRLRAALGPMHWLNGKFWEVSVDGNSPADFSEYLEQCPGGVVLKPTHGSGSRNVEIIDTPSAGQKRIIPGHYLVEEKFTGPEFSVEGMSWDGAYHPLVVTAKTTGGETGLVEIGQRQPAPITSEETDRFFAAAEEVLAIAGYEYGLSHIEFILEQGQPKLIEAHGRVGGDRIADLMQWTIGANAFEILLGTYRARDYPGSPKAPAATGRQAAIRFVDLSHWSESDEQWLAQVRACPEVAEAMILKPAGQRGPVSKSSDRHAHVVTVGDATSEALKALTDLGDS